MDWIFQSGAPGSTPAPGHAPESSKVLNLVSLTSSSLYHSSNPASSPQPHDLSGLPTPPLRQPAALLFGQLSGPSTNNLVLSIPSSRPSKHDLRLSASPYTRRGRRARLSSPTFFEDYLRLAHLSFIFAISHIPHVLSTFDLANMAREAAIREWAAKFEHDVLSKPEFAHLRPTGTKKDATVEEALGAEYETTSLSECVLAFLRPLKSLCTHYPSERGERAVLNCLTSAVIKRFVKGKDKGVPGLILEDVVLAEALAAEVMRRSGSVEHSSGEYQLAIPQQKGWIRWCKEMLESQPLWPKRADFTTKEQYDDAMGQVEQEWWEAWVNAIEKDWDCYIHDAIPVHLREPIAEQKGEDHVRLLHYNRHDGKEFDMGGRTVDDYRCPMDWTVSFTYHLLTLSHMTRDARHVGLEWMTAQVKARLEAPRTSKQPWLTLTDLKKIVKNLAANLDANKKVDTPMED